MRASRRHAWTGHVALQDLAVTVGLGFVTGLPLVHDPQASPRLWLLDLALVLPLAVRRREPSAVFVAVAVAAFLQWLVGQPLTADAALLLALYTVAAHDLRGRAVAAAGILLVGVVLAAVRFAPAGDGVVGSLVFLTGLVAAAFLSGTSRRTRSAYLASLEDRARRLEVERDQQVRLVRVAERTRIARELHDIVAHNLSVMITLAAGAAATTSTDTVTAAAAMDQVAQTGRDALTEMRQLLGFLREDQPPADRAPQPDLDQLDDLLGQVRSTGLPVRLRVQGQPRHLGPAAQLTVYRAVQEALTNTRKHGRAVSRADVQLVWLHAALDVVISDDGRAVEADRPGPLGVGLIGMRERVHAAGGTLTTGRCPTGGWRVHVHLPVDAPPATPSDTR